MVGHAQAQGTDARLLKHSAESDLPVPLAVPLRQNHERQTLPRFKVSPVDRIVGFVRSLDVTRIPQNVPVELVLRRGFVVVEGVAVRKRVLRICQERGSRIVGTRKAYVVQAPLKGQGPAIVVPRMMCAFT